MNKPFEGQMGQPTELLVIIAYAHKPPLKFLPEYPERVKV